MRQGNQILGMERYSFGGVFLAFQREPYRADESSEAAREYARPTEMPYAIGLIYSEIAWLSGAVYAGGLS